MSVRPAAPEACPPPLLWQDVRREYLARSTSTTVDSAAGPVAVRTWGAGPVLYCLPGFTSPAELYGLMIWLLRDEFQCVTIEPAEISKSPGRSASQTPMQQYVEMLRAVIQAQGVTKYSILGANFGAAWGLAMARAEPGSISRLILLHGFAHRRLSWSEWALKTACSFSRRTLSQFPGRETFQVQNHRRWFPPFDETRFQYFLDASGEIPLREVARRAHAVMLFDLRNSLSQILVPTLLVRTEGEGRVATTLQDELSRGLPNVRQEWLHNTGQLPYLTHPHRLAKLIRIFHAEDVIQKTVSAVSEEVVPTEI